MEPLWMCRVCMAEDGRMHPIAYTHLQGTYESLTSKPLETEDQRPTFVCYICYARLENSYQLRKACLLSERLFTKILSSYNPLFLPNGSGIGERLEIVHPVIQFSLSGDAPAEDAAGKNLLPGNVEVILLDELAACHDHTSRVDTGVHIDFRIDQGINAHKKRRLRAHKTNNSLNDEQTSSAAEQLGNNSSISIDNEQIAAKPLETSSNLLIDNEEVVAKPFEINSNNNEHIADKPLETSSNNILVEDKSDVKNKINCGKDNGDVKLNNQRKIKKTVRFNIEDNKLSRITAARKFAINSNKLINREQNITAVKRLEVSLNTLIGTDRIEAKESETNSNTLSNNKLEMNSNTLLDDEQIVAKQRKLRIQRTQNTYINIEQNPTAAKNRERNSNTVKDNEQIVTKQFDTNSNNSKIKKTVRFNIGQNQSGKSASVKRYVTDSNTLIDGDETTTAAKSLEVNLNTFIDTEQIAQNEFAPDSKKLSKNVFETNSITLLDDEQIVAKQRRLRSQKTPNTFADKEETPTAAKNLERNLHTLIDNEQIVTKQFDTNSNNSKIKKTVRFDIEDNQLGKSTSAKRYVTDSNTLIDDDQTTTAAKPLEVNLNTFKDTEQIAVNEFASDSKKLTKSVSETNSITLLDDEQIAATQRRLRSQKTSNTFADKEQTPTAAKNLERNLHTLIDNEQIVTKQFDTNSNNSKIKNTVRFDVEDNQLGKSTSAKGYVTDSNTLIDDDQTTTAARPLEANLNTFKDTEQIAVSEFASDSKKLTKSVCKTNSITLLDDEQIVATQRRLRSQRTSNTFADKEQTPTAAKNLERNLHTLIDNEQIVTKQFDTNSNNSKIKNTVRFDVEDIQLGKSTSAKGYVTDSNTLIDDDQTTTAAKPLEVHLNTFKDTEQSAVNEFAPDSKKLTKSVSETNSITLLDDEQIVATQRRLRSQRTPNTFTDKEQTPTAAKNLERKLHTLIDNEQIVTKQFDTNSKIKKTVRFDIEDNQLGKGTSAKRYITDSNTLIDGDQTTTAAKPLEVNLNTFKDTEQIAVNEFASDSKKMTKSVSETNSITLLDNEQIVATQRRLRSQRTPNTFTDKEQTPIAAKNLERNLHTLIDNEQIVTKQFDTNSKIKKTVRFDIEDNQLGKSTSAKRYVTDSNTLIDGDQTTTAAKPLEVNLNTFKDTEQIEVNEFASDSKKLSKNVFETNSITLLDDEQIVATQRRLRSQRTLTTFTDKEQTPTAAKNLERNSNTLIDNEQIVTKQLETNSNKSKIKKTVRFRIEENKNTLAKKIATNLNRLIVSDQTTIAPTPPEVNLNTLIDTEHIDNNKFATNSNTLADDKQVTDNAIERNSNIFKDAEDTLTAAKQLEVNLNTVTDNEQIVAKQFEKNSKALINSDLVVVKPLESNSNRSKIKKIVTINIEHNEGIAAHQLETNSKALIDNEKIAAKQLEASSNILIDNEQTPASVEQLATNSNNNAVEEIVYQCKVCNKYCTYPSDLRNHVRIHTGEKPYQCDVCDTCFSAKCNLKRHILSVHMGIKVPEKRRRKVKKRKHKNASIDTEQIPIAAGQLAKNSNNNEEKSESQNKIIEKRSKSNGNVRLRNKKAPRKKPIVPLLKGINQNQCQVCKKRFHNVSNLRRHHRCHTDEKPYQCDVCKKFFRTSSSLNCHILIHKDVKAYQCSVCKNSFRYQSNLRSHVREKHSNEKPCQCDICKKYFTRSALYSHLRTHTGERPFQCSICKKSFNHKSHLKTHMRKHTGEKPYQCHICKKYFSMNNNLKSHIRLRICKKPD